MPGIAEIRRALHGAWRLLLIDPRGLAEFDGSARGALRSFWAMAAVLPLGLVAAAIPVPSVGGATIPARDLILDAVGAVVNWLALLVLIYGLLRWYGRTERFWLFVSTYNWTQIPQATAVLVTVVLFAGSGMLADFETIASAPVSAQLLVGIAVLVALLIRVAIFAYEWYVAWVSLEAGAAIPIIVVLLDFALGLSITRLTTALP